MICTWWILICFVSVSLFQGLLLGIVIMTDRKGKHNCELKAAFELQSSCVFEKHRKTSHEVRLWTCFLTPQTPASNVHQTQDSGVCSIPR